MNTPNNPCPICSAETVQCDCPRPVVGIPTPTPETDDTLIHVRTDGKFVPVETFTKTQELYEATHAINVQLRADKQRALDVANHNGRIVDEMSRHLKPNLDELNVDCAKRVAAERDQLRKALETAQAESTAEAYTIKVEQIRLDAYRAGGLAAADITQRDIHQDENDWIIADAIQRDIITHFTNLKEMPNK